MYNPVPGHDNTEARYAHLEVPTVLRKVVAVLLSPKNLEGNLAQRLSRKDSMTELKGASTVELKKLGLGVYSVTDSRVGAPPIPLYAAYADPNARDGLRRTALAKWLTLKNQKDPRSLSIYNEIYSQMTSEDLNRGYAGSLHTFLNRGIVIDENIPRPGELEPTIDPNITDRYLHDVYSTEDGNFFVSVGEWWAPNRIVTTCYQFNSEGTPVESTGIGIECIHPADYVIPYLTKYSDHYVVNIQGTNKGNQKGVLVNHSTEWWVPAYNQESGEFEDRMCQNNRDYLYDESGLLVRSEPNTNLTSPRPSAVFERFILFWLGDSRSP